jgi:nicotinate phosphoribosyltransferase
VATSLPEYSLLLDTYDVRQGTANAITVAKEGFAQHGHTLTAVRLDSGDLAADSVMVRAMLDGAGLTDVRVLASGDIDEYKIEKFVAAGAPIDGYGVGGNLGVGLGSAESGTVGGVIGAVYKLAWYEGGADPARIKLAGAKSTWPGRKTAWRIGSYERDFIQLADEEPPEAGRELGAPWIEGGRLIAQEPTLHEIRDRAARSLSGLPAELRKLSVTRPYQVDVSARLAALREATIEALRRDAQAP